jgi:FKBP-type peptidyl-prolyl cis-trans isomerase (trigger factor)
VQTELEQMFSGQYGAFLDKVKDKKLLSQFYEQFARANFHGAMDRVKVDLILDKIVELEGIEVPEEAVREELAKISLEDEWKSPDEIKEMKTDDAFFLYMKQAIAKKQARDLVIDRAQLKRVAERTQKQAAHEHVHGPSCQHEHDEHHTHDHDAEEITSGDNSERAETNGSATGSEAPQP